MKKLDLSRFQHIVWDWNGTLLDDVDLVSALVQEQLATIGMPTLSHDEYRRRFRMPIHAFYQDIGIDLNRHSFSELNNYFQHQFEKRWPAETALFKDVPPLLEQIQSSGRSQCIVSAHPHQELEDAVLRFGIRDFFESVYGHRDRASQGTSKAAQAKEWMESSKFGPSDVVWIGDTTHDLEIAQSLEIACVLVAQGHQAAEVLKTTGAPVIESLAEIHFG